MDDSAIDKTVYVQLEETAGAEFAAELVDTFVEEAPRMFAELRSARAASDAERFRRTAHSLKSNGNTFGAVRFAALARELELRGLDTNPERDVAALAALEAEYKRAVAALKDLRHG